MCICAAKVATLNQRLDTLRGNLNFDLAPPAALPALGAKANAALAANASAAASAAANPALAATSPALAVSASPAVKAAARLKAVADLKASMAAKLGINLAAPAAPCMLNGLSRSLSASGLAAALGRLAGPGMESLLPLGRLADTLENVRTGLGLDLLDLAGLSPGALSASLAASAPAAASLTPGGTMPTPPRLSETAKLAATLDALTGAETALAAAFGTNLSTPAGIRATAAALSATGASLGKAGPMGGLPGLGLMAAAMQALSALDAIERAMGVDMSTPGATARLGAALGPLAANAAAAGRAAAGMGGSASAAARVAAGGGLGAAGSAGAAATPAAALSAQVAARTAALSQVAAALGGVPAVPPALALLPLLLGQIQRLGVDLVAFSPCRP